MAVNFHEEETADAAAEQAPALGTVPVVEEEKPEAQAEAEKPKPEAKATESEESEADQEQKPKRRGGFQRRIEKLEQEAEFWRDEALRNRAGSPTEAPKPPAKPTAPKLSTFQGTVEEYEKALEKYAGDLETYTQHQAQQSAAAKQAEQATQNVLTRLQEMDDYEEIDEAAQEHLPQELVRPLAAECAMFRNGAEVFRELMLDPEERESLLEMHRAQDILGIKTQLRALSVALRKQKPTAKQETQAVTTKAPKPPTPLTKTVTTDENPKDSDDIDVWMAKRKAQLLKQGKRV